MASREQKSRGSRRKGARRPVPRVTQAGATGVYRISGYGGSVGDKAMANDEFLQDPNIKASRPQALRKVDVIKMRLTPSDACTENTLAGGGDAPYKLARRVSWVIPQNLHWNEQGSSKAKDEGDNRGTFIDINTSTIVVKNTIHQNIRLLINSPRARVDDRSNPYVRTHKKEIVIPPGRRRTLKLRWGDNANIYSPMIVNLPLSEKRFIPSIVVCDLLIVYPEFSLDSGLKFSAQTDMVVAEVLVKQEYMTTLQYAGTVSVAKREEFGVTKLNTASDFLNEYILDATEFRLSGADVIHEGDVTVLNGMERGMQCAPKGILFTIQGLPGFYRYHLGRIVAWDVESDKPTLNLEAGVRIPGGLKMTVVESSCDVSASDFIGFLTALTEVLRILSVLF